MFAEREKKRRYKERRAFRVLQIIPYESSLTRINTRPIKGQNKSKNHPWQVSQLSFLPSLNCSHTHHSFGDENWYFCLDPRSGNLICSWFISFNFWQSPLLNYQATATVPVRTVFLEVESLGSDFLVDLEEEDDIFQLFFLVDSSTSICSCLHSLLQNGVLPLHNNFQSPSIKQGQ